MLYNDYTKELLDLKDVIVTGVSQDGNQCTIFLEMQRTTHICPSCGVQTNEVHDYRTQRIKDISIFGKITFLQLRKRRYHCPCCHKNFFEKVSFLPRYHRLTNRLSAYIVSEFRRVQPMSAIASRANLSAVTVARIFDHIQYSKPALTEVLSFDEFRGNAGGEKFQFILTDPKAHRVLDILSTRKSEDLYQYFSKYKDRQMVKYVVIDMNNNYRLLAHTCFPHATLVADKFQAQIL